MGTGRPGAIGEGMGMADEGKEEREREREGWVGWEYNRGGEGGGGETAGGLV
jgi:hypothetical protein